MISKIFSYSVGCLFTFKQHPLKYSFKGLMMSRRFIFLFLLIPLLAYLRIHRLIPGHQVYAYVFF